MYCSKCGSKLVASAAFCSSCGVATKEAEAANEGKATRETRLTLKPLHYPFTAALLLAFVGWLAGKPWGEEMAGIIGMAFIFGLVAAVIEIAVKYFRSR